MAHPKRLPKKIRYPRISVAPLAQFRHFIFNFVSSTMAPESSPQPSMSKARAGLKKSPPYWYAYTTMAKGCWLGKELLEFASTEFRDRTMEHHRYAIESGVTTVNGKVAKPDTIVRNGDRIGNIEHIHEPPVTATPVKIILRDEERGFVVIDKPGSIPVHSVRRYHKHTVVKILKTEYGFKNVYPVNRLDRLTSGLMILPLSAARAKEMVNEFMAGTVKKEYIARCKGKFPEDEVICEEPLLTIGQVGLNIVHPDGKLAKTIFKLIRYDANTDTSVVHCQPLTGRSHQIRVHLQFLGYPIANDFLYPEIKIWDSILGKGGIDTTPSEERAAPVAPPQFQFRPEDNPESLSKSRHAFSGAQDTRDADVESGGQRLLPRETDHDIGMGSPVPLSAEVVDVITKLRTMKDEDEDWSRWRNVVFRAKGALHPQHKRRRGGPATLQTNAQDDVETPPLEVINETELPDDTPNIVESIKDVEAAVPAAEETQESGPTEPPQITLGEALEKAKAHESSEGKTSVKTLAHPGTEELMFCPDCYLRLHPDPKPERLYIFLHALRYTTSLGRFETDMPEWAEEGWEWDRS